MIEVRVVRDDDALLWQGAGPDWTYAPGLIYSFFRHGTIVGNYTITVRENHEQASTRVEIT